MKQLIAKLESFLKRPIANLLVGAFFGASFAYIFMLFEQAQEINAKREVLFAMLREELPTIAGTVPLYDADKAFYRDPIRIQALPLLLDGQTLDYAEAPEVARRLLKLQVALTRYNDFVFITNLVQATREIPDRIHEQWHRIMTERHAAVITMRDEVLKNITK